MSSSRKQTIVISVLIVLIACAGWFANNFNNDFKDSNALSDTVVQTNKTLNYFADSRMSRDSKFEVGKADLESITKNKDLSKKVKEQATLKLFKLIEADKRENTIETLIKGRGFDDALCMITEKTVEVCVKNPVELTDKQAQDIKNIIVNTTKISPSDIYLKVKE